MEEQHRRRGAGKTRCAPNRRAIRGRRQQAILGSRALGRDALPPILRDYEIETLADDDAVLVCRRDESSSKDGASRGNNRRRKGG